MGKYAMTFGSAFNLIGELDGNQFKPKKYNTLIKYGDASARFYSRIKITDKDTVVGNSATGNSQDEIYINNVGQAFKDDIDKTYQINNKKYTMKDIVKEYFMYIKKELDNHQQNDPIDSMTLIVPYEYSETRKQELKNILKSISFRVDQILEEPIASYLGYLKHTNQEIKHKDSFMLIGIEDDNIKVKIFDIEYKKSQLIFKLDGSSFDTSFSFFDTLRKYFLEVMDVDVSYDKLTATDQDLLDTGINDLLKDFDSRKNDSANLYIGLSDIGAEYDNDFSKDMIIELFEKTGIIKSIYQTIDECIDQSRKTRSDINKIIYTGNISTIFGIQEKINRDFNLNQDLMLDIDELTCLGGVSNNNLTYKIEDHLKQIGIGVSKKVRFLRTVTTFKTTIPSYSSIKAQSLKIKIPASFKGKLGIYEGYNGAMIGDCTLLKNIDLSGYNDGNHLFALERKASGGSVTLLIYNKEGSIVKEFNIL